MTALSRYASIVFPEAESRTIVMSAAKRWGRAPRTTRLEGRNANAEVRESLAGFTASQRQGYVQYRENYLPIELREQAGSRFPVGRGTQRYL